MFSLYMLVIFFFCIYWLFSLYLCWGLIIHWSALYYVLFFFFILKKEKAKQNYTHSVILCCKLKVKKSLDFEDLKWIFYNLIRIFFFFLGHNVNYNGRLISQYFPIHCRFKSDNLQRRDELQYALQLNLVSYFNEEKSLPTSIPHIGRVTGSTWMHFYRWR